MSSVLIYEDYCRPPAIRAVERIVWWKRVRTTGIMQVSWEGVLTDEESVNRGLDILLASWDNFRHEEIWWRVRSTIADYNNDEDYIGRIFEVMKILAARTDPTFKSAYDRMYPE